MRVEINRVEEDGKITLQEGAGIAIVTINRPPTKNAMTVKMWKELARIGSEIPQNPKMKVVILRGATGMFSAGSDIEEFSQLNLDEVNQAFIQMEEAISVFEKMELPTIALVNGPSMGAGFELALACDLRVGTPDTKMGIPVGRLGITLSKKFVKRIADLIGTSRTKELVYTSRILNPEEAFDWGLLNYLVTEEDPANYTLRLAEKIKQHSRASLRAVKEGAAYANPSFDIPLSTDFERSADPTDFPEGILAFLEKRPAQFD